MIFSLLVGSLIASIAVPLLVFWAGKRDKSRFTKCLAANVISFFAVLVFATLCVFNGTASAAGGEAASAAGDFSAGMAYLGAALSTGLGSIGAGVATGQAASAALGALSENEGIMGRAIIFVGLAEGVAIYGLIIAFMILGKV